MIAIFLKLDLRWLCAALCLSLLVACSSRPASLDGYISENGNYRDNGKFQNSDGTQINKSFGELLSWWWERLGNIPDPMRFESVSADDEALQPVAPKPSITWIGHASYLYRVGDVAILTDPHFTQRASPVSFAGPKRYMPPGLTIEELPKIDIDSISHNHYDHLDLKSVKTLAARDPETLFVVPMGMLDWFEEEGITNVRQYDWWQDEVIGNTKVTFVPVHHWSGRSLTDRNLTLWGGWHFDVGGRSFVHLGDTGYSKDFTQIRERLGPVDLAAIPIGAYAPIWFMKAAHVSPAEAVQIYIDLEADDAVGMHWGTFILTDEPVDEPPKLLAQSLEERSISADRFRVLKHGETWNLN